MEEWSILNDYVKYVMHDESDAFHKLNLDLMNYWQNRDLYKKLNSEEMLKNKSELWLESRKVEISLFRHV